MTIETRINAMTSHLKSDWESVGMLTGENELNKNIENIAAALDRVYDGLPKASGTGEVIQLENTRQGGTKLDYKGNTYQKTTNNLMNLNVVGPSGTQYNIKEPTITNGVVNVQGKNDTSYDTKGKYQNGYVTIGTTQKWVENKTYYISFKLQIVSNPKNLTTDYFIIGLFGGRFENIRYNSNTGRYEGSITTTSISDSDKEKTIIEFRVDGMELNISEISLKETEDYTFNGYGISPTPDIPSHIHVVSGDNSIEICGKNLLGLQDVASTTTDGITYSVSNGEITISGTKGNSGNVDIPLTQNVTLANGTTYTYSGVLSGTLSKNINVNLYNGTNDIISTRQDLLPITGSSYSGIATTLRLYIPYGTIFTNFKMKLQLEKGTITPYEPYTGASYPINLPVENILNNIATTTTIDHVTFTVNEDKSITINGTPSKGANILLDTISFVSGETYTISGVTGFSDTTLQIYTLSTNAFSTGNRLQSFNGAVTRTAQANETCSVKLYVYPNVTYNNVTIYPQIEKGRKANSYTPYGTTPIWLGWIPNTDYGDKIDKSTGKNLFDIEQFLKDSEATYTKNGEGSYTTQNYSKLYSTPYVFNDTDIPVSLSGIIDNGTATNIRVQLLDSSNNVVGEITSSSSSLVNKSACKLRFNWSTAGTFTFKNIMLNTGSTALPYEPYGTSWYLKKEIGKVVLNGTEAHWAANTSGSNKIFYREIIGKSGATGTNVRVYTNYFKYNSGLNWQLLSNYEITMQSNSYYIFIRYDEVVTLDGFKTWLGTHNTEVYYVLATPTYTKIEGELLNQLEAIKMSYEGQTNISQTNNDLPFELDAKALLSFES